MGAIREGKLSSIVAKRLLLNYMKFASKNNK
jgi:hypothetical protein